MVHNTATKAAESFEAETGFDVEDKLVDLYYWFDKSTKRKNELSNYCEFCDVRYRGYQACVDPLAQPGVCCSAHFAAIPCIEILLSVFI